MNYIFIDESRIAKKNRFQLFGSLWLRRKDQNNFRHNFWQLWDKSFPSRKSELKWTKVSKNKLEIYKNFADYFARLPLIDFRYVVLDTHDIDYQIYHQGDKELGFYKFLQNGYYFTTICTQNREMFFGNIAGGKMQLSPIGKIVQKFWLAIPTHFPFVKLDTFIIMPNHIHGIIGIDNQLSVHVGTGQCPVPTCKIGI